ncbi:MAG: methyltransferase domain-containing protein [Bacteroidota bacterium]
MTERKFAYKELDQEGLETLETIAAADKFNRWMFETVAEHIIPGKILEVGSGIGNISQFFLDEGYEICLSDIRENYCGYLEEKFSGQKNLLDIVKLDLVHPEFEREYADQLGQYDNVYALNVIEHIEDDVLAMKNCRKLLRPGGRIIILVPAYQSLYNQFDKALFHFRRYTKSTMAKVFDASGFEIKERFHFNFIGIFGWFFTGKILRKETIPSGQMGLYNTLVPVFRVIDKLIFRLFGLSVILVGDKPADS